MEENAKFMCKLFKSKKSFLIGRNGTIELDTLIFHYAKLELQESKLNQLELNAGIFPKEYAHQFAEDLLESLKQCDIIAEGWYAPLADSEKYILDSINKDRFKIMLRNLEPYYVAPELRWTQYLAGKRVAIINSFAEVCETQTYMSKAIWPHDYETLLPTNTTWIPINTYYSPALSDGNASWPPHIKNYKDAVKDVVLRVIAEQCDVALIGCGGMGMLIGHELKNHGLQCVVMGGALQILFGIRGKRWEKHSTISKFFNDAWVFPPESCKPKNSHLVEHGCYW